MGLSLRSQAQPLTNLSTSQPFTILPGSLPPFTNQTSSTQTYPSYPGNTSYDFLNSSLVLNFIQKPRGSPVSQTSVSPVSGVSVSGGFLPDSFATSPSGTIVLSLHCHDPIFAWLLFYTWRNSTPTLPSQLTFLNHFNHTIRSSRQF